MARARGVWGGVGGASVVAYSDRYQSQDISLLTILVGINYILAIDPLTYASDNIDQS